MGRERGASEGPGDWGTGAVEDLWLWAKAGRAGCSRVQRRGPGPAAVIVTGICNHGNKAC